MYNLDPKDNMEGLMDAWAVKSELPVQKGEKLIAVRRVYNKTPPVESVVWRGPERIPYGFTYNYPILPGDE